LAVKDFQPIQKEAQLIEEELMKARKSEARRIEPTEPKAQSIQLPKEKGNWRDWIDWEGWWIDSVVESRTSKDKIRNIESIQSKV